MGIQLQTQTLWRRFSYFVFLLIHLLYGLGGSNQHPMCSGSTQPLSYTPVLCAGDLFAAPDCLPDIFIRTIRTHVTGLQGCVFLSGSKSSDTEKQWTMESEDESGSSIKLICGEGRNNSSKVKVGLWDQSVPSFRLWVIVRQRAWPKCQDRIWQRRQKINGSILHFVFESSSKLSPPLM